MARIVGIDYGLKRTGLAATDPLKIIASTLETVPSQEVLNFLKEYTLQEEVESFVLGMPKNLDLSDTDSTAAVQKFQKQLEKTFPDKPVHLVDERFTSKMAKQAMLSGGMKKKDRRKKENVDKISATIILQSYLEQQSFL